MSRSNAFIEESMTRIRFAQDGHDADYNLNLTAGADPATHSTAFVLK